MRLQEPLNVSIRGWIGSEHLFARGGEPGVLAVLLLPGRRRGTFAFGEDSFSIEPGQGLIRTYYQMWDQNREFLGASYRWNPFRRRIVVLLGNAVYNLVPSRGFGRGADLYDGRGERALSLRPRRLGARGTRMELYRKFEVPQIGLVYFLYRRLGIGSILPGPRPRPARRV